MATTPIAPGDTKAILLSIVNQMEGSSITTADVDFGLPQRATGSLPVRNTKILITPKSDSGYYGIKTLWYNRIHISELGNIVVNKGTATTVSQLLPAINSKYGISLTAGDIVDEALSPAQTGEIVVYLNINPNSLMFYTGLIIPTQGFTPGTPVNVLVPAVWDQIVKSALITIGPEEYEMSSAAGISVVRSSTSFTSGKRYFELTNNSVNGLIGFGLSSASTAVLMGSDANSWALDTFTGLITHNGAIVMDLSSQVALMEDNPVGFMLDLDTKALTLVLTGNVRVDVTGITIPDAPIFILAGNKSTTAAVTNIEANFGATSFTFQVPFDYYPGFGTGGSVVSPTAGTLLSQACIGFDMVGTYANGNGGTYTAVLEANAVACGYISGTTPAPSTTAPPTSTPAPTPTTLISVDALTASVDENGIASAVYTLTPIINENVLLEAYVVKDTSSDVDYGTLEYQIGSGAWTQVDPSNLLTIPANTAQFSLRLAMIEDNETEGSEAFDFHVSKQPTSTNVSNTAALTKTFTINDTSIFIPTIPQVHEQLTLSNSGTIIIPAGVLEATVNGQGETGVSAVIDNLIDGSSLYFRKVTEPAAVQWVGSAVNAAGDLALRISSTGILQSTTDGDTWTEIAITTPAGISNNISAFTFVNGHFYIFTSNAVAYRSTDGNVWAALSDFSGQAGVVFTQLAYGNGNYFLITNSNVYGKSTDGINFTISDFLTDFGAAFTYGPMSVAFGNGLFVGTYPFTTNEVITSADLVTWTKRPLATLTSNANYRAITYVNNKFVVSRIVGVSESEYQISTDGITWTSEFFSGDLSQFTFLSVNNVLIATKNDNLEKYLSTDMSAWEDISSSYSVPLTNLIYFNGKYRTSSFGSTLSFVGGPEPVNTVVVLEPAITGDTAEIEILGTTYSYPGSNNSTPPAADTDTVTIDQLTDTTVTYTAPAGTTLEIEYYRDEANCLIVAIPANTAAAVIAEGDSTILVYNLEKPLERAVTFTFNSVFNTASAQDISFIEYSIGIGSYTQVSDGDQITIPIGQTALNIRVTALTDFDIETDETLTISLEKLAGTTVVLNTTPLTQAVTITNVVNNSAVIVMPTWMNLSKSSNTVTINPSNKQIVQFSNAGTVYSRNSASSGKYYFEVSDFPIDYDSFVGLAVPGIDMVVFAGWYGNTHHYVNSEILDLRPAVLYTNGDNPSATYTTNSTASTVYGFAVDFDNNQLEIFKDNVSMVSKTMVFSPTDEVFIVAGLWNTVSAQIKINTGQTAFTYTPPTGFSAGFGKALTYFDDYENNNKSFIDGTPVQNLFDIYDDGQTITTGAYSSTTDSVPIAFTNVNGIVSILPNTVEYYKDYRLTIDMSYEDGAETNPGVEWEERQFSFVTYVDDPAGTTLPLVVSIYNRLSDGSQLILSGNSTYALPRSMYGITSVPFPQAPISIPFDGRHKVIYEVVSVPTGKEHTLLIDDVVVATGIDTNQDKDTLIAVHPIFGWGGDIEIFSYKIENITKDDFSTTPYAIVTNAVWTLWDSAVLTNGDLTVSYTDYAGSNVSTAGSDIYYGKWYWELTVDEIDPNALLNVGIIVDSSARNSNDTPAFDISTDLNGIETVHLFPSGTLNQNDVISVMFDADNGILKIRVNNASEITIEDIQVRTQWFAVMGDSGAIALTTITANFGASAFTYTPPAGYFPGIGYKTI